ncbi:uncharacterized protein J7T54_000447 [Emericellopsis cladophorae]|uniref:C2H2-type domain-containing protein n=1 Tax=Emericellopsis cladophorae TaxID=2686198 RepID=A0A9P9XWX5_9HYPO|nr:uncharacterized protein J7T54_000447 [Emericellopsis cladophorae]KAI6779349.1 hypothetical protein J7T54_000447 [Emericellopsis cladophorae]
MCPHCGRTFKRTEHLERHVRTHTKEKPFLCHCGAAFARRDLLTRHFRVADHGEQPTPSDKSSGRGTQEPNVHMDVRPGLDRHDTGEADIAAAVSLSGLSGDPWHAQQGPPAPPPQHEINTGLPHQGLQEQGIPPPPSLHSQQSGPLPHEVPQPQPIAQQPMPGPLDDQRRNGFMDTGQFVPGVLSPQLFDGSVDFDPHFREFANFLDGVGLPTEWSPYFNNPESTIDPGLKEDGGEAASPKSGPRTRAGTPFSSWLPSAPTGNRIANYVSITDNPRAIDPETRPFKITEDQRSKLLGSLEPLAPLLPPGFRLPSRHALTRYITSFFEGFHSHMPFIHPPTWHVLEHPLELILGIAAIGAQYCFEHRVSGRLFYSGKAILMERLGRGADGLGPRTRSFMTLNSPGTMGLNGIDGGINAVETVRALITLMGFATWEPTSTMVQESFSLQGLLTHVLRDIGLDETEASSPESSAAPEGEGLEHEWRAWVDAESHRRTKLIAFSFLHTHSIAYNVYPVLRSNEVNLRLPCATKEWKAPTPQLWHAARREVGRQQLYFQEALSVLLRNKECAAALDPIPTPLGNYVLLHGLLQRIHIVRDLSLPVMSSSAALPAEEVEKLERGLRSWTSGWQQAPESTLDPNNENGPIPFTSSSLLALAYVRIYLHLGPYRHLETRDPHRIASAIFQSPDIERSDGVIAALLYTAHMISIPVRLGVDRVARSQAFFWSVRHSLASLDCGVLLSKWLSRLGDTVASLPLSDSEDRILHWVRCIVEEAYQGVDFHEEHDIPQFLDFRDPSNLSLAVIKIWAHFFKSNTQWPFINVIGQSLERYRDMLVQKRLREMARVQ